VANEVLSILKLDNLKEEEMKSQISTFMKISSETFAKLKALSKGIKDFQSQKEGANETRKNKGREIGLGFDEEEDSGHFWRDEQGNIQRRKNQLDMKMTIQEEDLNEDLAEEVMEEVGPEEDQTQEFGSKTNKARTGSQEAKRKKRVGSKQAGIQSVMFRGEGALAQVQEDIEEEDDNQSQVQETFDRGREFLDGLLGTGNLSQTQLRRLVDVLGRDDKAECQNELFEFIEEHEDSLNSDVDAIKEVYENRDELFFNISLDLYKDDPIEMDALIRKMKKSEKGAIILEQKARQSINLQNQESEGDQDKIGHIILQSKEMKDILEKSKLLQRKLNKLEDLDNETLAGLSKNTLRMKFKVKQSSAIVGKNIKMPRGTTKFTEKGYEVVKIPAETKKGDFGIKLKVVKEVMPEYMHTIFNKIEKFNKIQVRGGVELTHSQKSSSPFSNPSQTP
jgi:hypothetical protein